MDRVSKRVEYMWQAILYSTISGVIGTGVGGLLSIFVGKRGVIPYILSFAGGFMIAIVCFDLLPEALTNGNIFILICFVMAGVLCVRMIDYLVEYRDRQTKIMVENRQNDRNDKMIRMGVFIAIAIALHNFPEGLVIGTSEVNNKGLAMALLICMHNIPEGLAMAVPLIGGKCNYWKAVLLCFLSGAPTVLGAIIGFWLGNISAVFIEICLALAAGAMLYITFADVLPDAYSAGDSKHLSFAILIGLLGGLLACTVI